MNYRNEAKTYLKSYNTLKASMKRMQARIDRLCSGPHYIKGMTYDSISSSNAPVHDDVINVMYELQVLMQSLEQTKQDIADIDLGLDHVEKKLGKLHRQILIGMYIEDKDPKTVARELSYSERQIRRKAYEGLSEFAVLFLGIIALQGE